MPIISINPSTEEINQEFDYFSEQDIFKICKEAKNAFSEWKKLTLTKRIPYLKKVADLLRQNKNEYAKLITLEMGKPISQSISEIEKCAWATDIFCDHALSWSEDVEIKTDAKKSFVTYEPIGVILAIMPWNFPFWQLIRCAVPALLMGNTVILKHSNVVPMCAVALEKLFKEALLPQHVFSTIFSDHDVIKKMFKRNFIQGVSLTGSVNAGKKVGELAGKNIKKFVLELGGSDPFVVLDDADIPFTAQKAAEGRNVNSGQSCVSSKRFIVVKKVAEQFIHQFVQQMKQLKVGDPFDTNTETGPLATEDQLKKLEEQVASSVSMGAEVKTGGKRLNRKGFFYEPTVMTQIKKHMPIFKDEVFGPVAPVIIAKNTNDALKLANDSNLGLGGSVWTTDLEKGERLAREIQSGLVFVNGIVKSDPRLPFGGVKDSGIGRELSRYGMLEFVNIKSIVIA